MRTIETLTNNDFIRVISFLFVKKWSKLKAGEISAILTIDFLCLTIKELNTIEKMENNRKNPNLGYFLDIFF